VVDRAEKSPAIQTLVVGMHAALPGSWGDAHSMSNWPQGNVTGREVYEALWHAQTVAHKKVYVLASHSHFYMDDVFNTATWKGKVLPGWIIGTAGAVRYRLPAKRHDRRVRLYAGHRRGRWLGNIFLPTGQTGRPAKNQPGQVPAVPGALVRGSE
jgi:hypothetical protein